MCVSLFADIILRSSDIDLDFVKMLHHPSGAAGSSQRTILTATDGTNHVVYNLHTMSPTSNIISCDSIEEATVTPIASSHAEIAVRSSLDDDLNEYVICEKADTKSPGSCYSVVVVAASPTQPPPLAATGMALPNNSSAISPVADPLIHSAPRIKEPGSDRPKFVCPKCGSKFSALRNMKRHYHHECGIEPKHGCDLCPMRFKRRNLLKYHIVRKHTPKSGSS